MQENEEKNARKKEKKCKKKNARKECKKTPVCGASFSHSPVLPVEINYVNENRTKAQI